MIFRSVNHKNKRVTIGATTEDEWESVLELISLVDVECAVGKTNNDN